MNFPFFKKKQVMQEVSLQEAKIVADDLDSKKIKNNKTQFIEAQKELKKRIEECKPFLQKLETAKLKNDKIPDQHFNLMEGSRASMIESTQKFLSSIEIPNSLEEIDKFKNKYDNSFQFYEKHTKKTFMILPEFFEWELKRIVNAIRRVDETAKEIFRLSDLSKRVSGQIGQLESALSNKKKLETELKEIETRQADASSQITNIESEIIKFKTGKAREDNNKLAAACESAMNEHAKTVSNLATAFSPLSSSLRKLSFVRPDLTVTLNPYLEDPVKAVEKDKSLEIINILNTLIHEIDKVGLREDKAERVVKAAKNISREDLTNQVKKMKMSRAKEREAKKELELSTYKTKLDALRAKLQKAKENQQKLTDEYSYTKKKFENIEISKIKDEAEKVLGSKIVLQI